MAMTLRLSDELDRTLGDIAERRHMSKHAVIVEAAERFAANEERRTNVDAALDFVLHHDAELLERLADA